MPTPTDYSSQGPRGSTSDVPIGYETFRIHTALRAHFTSKYDFFTYKGLTKNNRLDHYRNCKPRYYYNRLEKKYDRDILGFLISNMVVDPTIFVGNMFEDEQYDKRFKSWIGRTQSLPYTFEQDIKRCIIDQGVTKVNCREYFFPLKGVPPLFNDLLLGRMSNESFIILNTLLKISDKWSALNKGIDGNPLLIERNFRLTKYQKFIEVQNIEDYRKSLITALDK